MYSPAGSTASPSIGLAAPPKKLEGKKLGILDNTKPNARLFMLTAAGVLEEKYGVELAQIYEKNAALAAPEDLIQGLSREVEIVLTGSAD